MNIRLTDGKEYSLVDCKQQCDMTTGEARLECILSKEYDFNEVLERLKKDEIAEILTIYDDDRNRIFESKAYRNVKSISNDIKTNTIIIEFNNAEDK